MKTLAASATVLGIWLSVWSQPAGVSVVGSAAAATPWFPSEAVSPTAPPAAELNEVIEEYCVRCHNERRLRGNLSLEGFDVEAAHEQAETAEKMIVKLRLGMMPPPGQKRPSADTLLALVETLETVVDEAAAANPNPGLRRFQRLNRSEYTKVIHDLLALEVDAGRWLPADTYLGNFDNLSAAQGLSTTLLEGYLRAAAEIGRLAVGNPSAQPVTTTYKTALEASQHAWDHVEGAPYGTRGGLVATHDFPVDGEYVFEVETFLGRGAVSEMFDISIDGEGIALLGIEHGAATTVPIRTEPIFVRAGQRQVSSAFIRSTEGPTRTG